MCVEVEKPSYRFIILFFNCLLTFGSYYCFDMPSVLQDYMEKDYRCNITINGTECCEDCLGMSPSQYNLLYAVYSWTSAAVVLVAGFFIDKYGNQVGAFLFSLLCVLGSAVFAIGALNRGSAYMFPLMLIGRLLFGAGNGSLTIVQNRITTFWFNGKELAMAFGFTLAFSRLGSVLNFLLTGNLNNAVGITVTLWIGSGLCVLGFISSIVVGCLDVNGFRKLGLMEDINNQSKRLKLSDVKSFSLPYWLIILTIMFFYNGVFPFVADASKFIRDKYGYDDNTSAYMAGAVYDVSLLLSPFLGAFIDIFGKRGILCIACSILTIPVFGLLAFTHVHPLVSTLWLGFTYSVAAASMWPSIPLVVAQDLVGTAMGIATSLQMVGIGFSNLIVGQILGKTDDLPHPEELLRWKYVMIYLLANVLACVVTSFVLTIHDTRKNGVLNLNRKEAHEKIMNEALLSFESEPDSETLQQPINN